MSKLQDLREGRTKLAVLGLGYVGMPLAVAFAEKFSVIGYDQNREKIESYQYGIDVTGEVGSEVLKASTLEFTSNPARLKEASFIVVAVPTPIYGDKKPDLTPIRGASKTVGEYIQPGTTVVYESTVYPGVTETICAPIIEQESKLICGQDFKIGYSPERINPGDKVHRLKNIVKIVSGQDEETLEEIAAIYEEVIDTVYRAPDIRVAEAAKLVENSQRDINIAFMNELALVFHRMNIDTNEVIKAMNTKWNALGFLPGLVGGHCIGVDPYYFIYQAENLGYHSPLITVGRRINDGMSEFVAKETVKSLIRAHIDTSKANIYLMGMTFKENCPDTRNSRAVDVYRHLEEYGLEVKAVDPLADASEFFCEYGIMLTPLEEVQEADCLLFLVGHSQFAALTGEALTAMYRAQEHQKRVLIDVKSIFSRAEKEAEGYLYWSL